MISAYLPVPGRTRTEMMPDSSRPLTSGCAEELLADPRIVHMFSAMSYAIGAVQAALPVTAKPRAPHGSGMWIPAKAKSSRSGRAEARESCCPVSGQMRIASRS